MKVRRLNFSFAVVILSLQGLISAKAENCQGLLESYHASEDEMNNVCHAEVWPSRKATCIPIFRQVVARAGMLLKSRCSFDYDDVRSTYVQLKGHIADYQSEGRAGRSYSGNSGYGSAPRVGACYGPYGPGFWASGMCVTAGGHVGPGQ
jgi:hypothetical protein